MPPCALAAFVAFACISSPVALAQEPPLLARVRAAAKDAPLVVAHRGASADFPENTLASFRAGVAAKADVIELDVWQTKDGAWMCLHDATVDRTTDALAKLGRKDVRIDSLTRAQLAELDAGTWKSAQFAGEKIPSLADALAAIRPVLAMVECKGGDANAFVAELRRLHAVERVIVQSFDWDWLETVHRAEPKLLIAALCGKEPTRERVADLQRTGARIVHWDHRTLDADTAAAVRAQGQMLSVYTVNPDLLLLGAAAIGCDLITTDRPARLAALRARTQALHATAAR